MELNLRQYKKFSLSIRNSVSTEYFIDPKKLENVDSYIELVVLSDHIDFIVHTLLKLR